MLKTLGSKRVLLRSESKWEIVPALILIEDHSILEIQKYPDSAKIASCQEWFGDDFITPGFMDSHTHLCLQFLRGGVFQNAGGNLVEDLFFKLEEKLTPDDVKAFSRMGAYEVLLSGSTFVWDHYYYGQSVAEAMIDVGLTGTIASTLQDLSGPGRNLWEMGLDHTEKLAHDESRGRNGIFSALGPHATDTVSPELWTKISDTAGRHNLSIHCHVAQSPEEYKRVVARHGLSPTALLERLGVLGSRQPKHLVHMIYASEADLKICNNPSVRLIACPHSQLIFHFPASYHQWWRQGNLWAVGTDCSASNDSWHMPEELRLIAGWPMVVASQGPEIADFMTQPSPKNLEKLAEKRTNLQAENLVNQDHLLNILFLGSSDGLPSHPKVNGILGGSLANLLVWNSKDPALWPDSNFLRSLIYNSLFPALKGIMTAGQWRGEIGNPRKTIVSSDRYQNDRREAIVRLSELMKRVGIAI